MNPIYTSSVETSPLNIRLGTADFIVIDTKLRVIQNGNVMYILQGYHEGFPNKKVAYFEEDLLFADTNISKRFCHTRPLTLDEKIRYIKANELTDLDQDIPDGIVIRDIGPFFVDYSRVWINGAFRGTDEEFREYMEEIK